MIFSSNIYVFLNCPCFYNYLGGGDANTTLSFKDIKNFPKQLWFIVYINCSFYGTIFPVISMIDLLKHDYFMWQLIFAYLFPKGNLKLFYMYKYKFSSYHASICNRFVNID